MFYLYSVKFIVVETWMLKRDMVLKQIVLLGIVEDITTTLEKFGKVAKIVRVPSTEEGKFSAIVEFESDTANSLIEPQLPFDTRNISDTTVKWHLNSIEVLMMVVELIFTIA